MPPSTPQLEGDAEIVRRELERKVVELQGQLAVGEKLIEDITLKDGVPTPIPHGLGRPVRWMAPSCVRGATSNGRVEEVRDGTVDRTKYVNLRAVGFGGPVTFSLRVL